MAAGWMRSAMARRAVRKRTDKPPVGGVGWGVAGVGGLGRAVGNKVRPGGIRHCGRGRS